MLVVGGRSERGLADLGRICRWLSLGWCVGLGWAQWGIGRGLAEDYFCLLDCLWVGRPKTGRRPVPMHGQSVADGEDLC